MQVRGGFYFLILATGMPIIMYWNYEKDANLSAEYVDQGGGDYKLVKYYRTSNQALLWSDHSDKTEYSWSLKYWQKGRIILDHVKAVNDAWDAANK